MTDPTGPSTDRTTEATRGAPRRGRVLAWGLWDWGSAAFNAVVTTFVFTVYLTSDAFEAPGALSVEAQLGWALAIAGLLIAVLAPITGQRSDTSGRRKFWLAVNTYIVVACTLAMVFVLPAPEYLLLGLFLVAAGNVFFEFAGVNYNAMLVQVSTPRTIGKVSGFGWGMGYVGGIVLLLIVYFGFIQPEVGLFGVTSDQGLDVRVTMVVSALWFGLFALPVLLTVPEYRDPAAIDRGRVGFFASYARLGRDIARLWRTERNTAVGRAPGSTANVVPALDLESTPAPASSRCGSPGKRSRTAGTTSTTTTAAAHRRDDRGDRARRTTATTPAIAATATETAPSSPSPASADARATVPIHHMASAVGRWMRSASTSGICSTAPLTTARLAALPESGFRG